VTAAVVLAAGASTRMGRPKPLLPVAGGSLLRSVVEPLLRCALEPLVVVLGADAERVRHEAGLPADARLRLVTHEGWREGMASSLRRGLSCCLEADAALVVLGDQAGLSAARVERVLEAARSGAPLVVPVHAGRAGHPVLFRRELFGELGELRGDVGARAVVMRHLSRATLVELEPLRDVDSEADYRALREGRPPEGDLGLPLQAARPRRGV
jgi:molybdenum cofactor cytidylyltransferase